MEDEGSASSVASETSGDVIGRMASMFITMLQTFVGLPLLILFDYCLNIVEKSAQWCLPTHEISAEENGKMFSKIELVRLLSWLLFLPGVTILRIIRRGLNVGAFLFGYPRVEAIVMVKFLQECRRRLRAVHLKAAESSRRRAASPDEKSSTESVGSPTLGDAKRKSSQITPIDKMVKGKFQYMSDFLQWPKTFSDANYSRTELYDALAMQAKKTVASGGSNAPGGTNAKPIAFVVAIPKTTPPISDTVQELLEKLTMLVENLEQAKEFYRDKLIDVLVMCDECSTMQETLEVIYAAEKGIPPPEELEGDAFV